MNERGIIRPARRPVKARPPTERPPPRRGHDRPLTARPRCGAVPFLRPPARSFGVAAGRPGRDNHGMDERQALLATISADPEDDAVRLVYADWLDEHGGEPRRAELIRTQ